MSGVNWDEPDDDEWNGHDDIEPTPLGKTEVEPILNTTIPTRKSGPLFGWWKTHIAYLKRLEAEHVEALAIIRADIREAGQRRKDAGET